MAAGSGRRWDVLVIGAGVIGLSAAYHIKENNPQLSVLMIDRNAAPGQGDTAKSMAALRDTFTSDVNRQLARSTINFYKHVQTEIGFNLNLDMVGYLWLLTEKQYTAYESFANQMLTQGIRLRLVERDELTSLMPDLVLDPATEQSKILGLESIHKAVFGLDCGIVAPDLIAKFYENAYTKLGGELQFSTDAKILHLGARKPLGLPGEPFAWQDKVFKEVETNHGTILADKIVLAAGIRTAALLDPLGVDCLTKPQKNQVYQVRGENVQRLLKTKGFNPQGTVPFTILPRGEAYFRPNPGERSFWLSSAAGFGQAFKLEEDPIADEKNYTYNIYPILSEYFPCFANLRPVNSWAGFYDVNSVDFTPIVARISNGVLVTGMSGSGIMKADAVGRMAAAITEGKDEAKLFGDQRISTLRLGLRNRAVPKEEFVI